MKATTKDIEENKVLSALAYVSILCFLPLFLKQDSDYAQFHAKQGLSLFIVEIGIFVVMSIPIINILLLPFAFIFSLIVIAFSFWGIVNAFNGQMRELPFFSEIGKHINL